MTVLSILILVKIFFPTLGVTVHRQRYDYTTAQFVSEIGGAAGLVLGASVISIVKILDDFITNIKVYSIPYTL